jgi:hypothetical protein
MTKALNTVTRAMTGQRGTPFEKIIKKDEEFPNPPFHAQRLRFEERKVIRR